jgi:hypothetical protein
LCAANVAAAVTPAVLMKSLRFIFYIPFNIFIIC